MQDISGGETVWVGCICWVIVICIPEFRMGGCGNSCSSPPFEVHDLDRHPLVLVHLAIKEAGGEESVVESLATAE